ncbi:hypothetical protein DSCA_32970 [Desulfosarcina alkanivorans]|uniref:Uncharacterized protein n=1 Tax=Desulfosarcina alkanivorans TaxID=571177 RepID=A0A5K7YXF9_9BACT|nr:hypothetical protein DSCA_32970 [Desulfosarcina alkanivorans]
MHGDRVLYAFAIALGGAPEGDKLEEGEWPTPEGQYVMDWRNPGSRFYTFIHISCPSEQDRRMHCPEPFRHGCGLVPHR